jgi:hypothetical protein
VAELVMVEEIFIAQTQAIDALFEEIFKRMLNAVGVAMVCKVSAALSNRANFARWPGPGRASWIAR